MVHLVHFKQWYTWSTNQLVHLVMSPFNPTVHPPEQVDTADTYRMDTNFGLFAATNLSDNVTVLTATPQPLPPNNKQVGCNSAPRKKN